MQINYNGRRGVLATMHEKEKVIGPVLQQELGLAIFVPEKFNTDVFGTFTRDIKRAGDQLEAARAKAIAAMHATGATIGIASEGSFGEHPASALIPYNTEIVMFIDKERELEVIGRHASSTTNLNQRYVRSWEAAAAFAREVDFPTHGVIVRKNEKDTRSMVKGITDWNVLEKEVKKLLSKFFVRKIFLETDMRALHNPTRMEHIRLAALDLAKRLKTPCPKCRKPGFGYSGTKGGLRCELCGSPTDTTSATLFTCPSCAHTQEELVPERAAPAMECAKCNP